MKVRRIIVGELGTNCYLVWDQECLQGVVIDPGAEGPKIIDEIKSQSLRISGILLTHAHFDHTLACENVQSETGSLVYLGEKDLDLLKDPGWMQYASGSSSFPSYDKLKEKIKVLKEGDVVEFGKKTLTAIETPGHTPGSLSYLGEGHLFCGDLLFRGSVGRTDLPMGNEEELLHSITHKVLTLPDKTIIHPGHNGPSTIGREKEENPYLNLLSW